MKDSTKLVIAIAGIGVGAYVLNNIDFSGNSSGAQQNGGNNFTFPAQAAGLGIFAILVSIAAAL